jgi:hypothetical protein
MNRTKLMKIRTGFVSNSSSSSFIIRPKHLSWVKSGEMFWFNSEFYEELIGGCCVLGSEALASINKKLDAWDAMSETERIKTMSWDISSDISCILYDDHSDNIDHMDRAELKLNRKYGIDLPDDARSAFIASMADYKDREVRRAYDDWLKSTCENVAVKLINQGFAKVEYADDDGKPMDAVMEHYVMPRVVEIIGDGYIINKH